MCYKEWYENLGELDTTVETAVLLTKLQSTHYAEGELKSDKPVEIYNIDVIISAGYRVKFKRGTHGWRERYLGALVDTVSATAGRAELDFYANLMMYNDSYFTDNMI